MNTSRRYSPEVRERAVRMVLEQQKEHSSQWAAIQSIASKLGCTNETLRRWVRQMEYDQELMRLKRKVAKGANWEWDFAHRSQFPIC